MSYEILDHPADVRFQSHGATLEAAFSAAADAVAALVGSEPESGGEAVTRPIELSARDHEALLFDFLNEVILLQDLEDAVVTGTTDLVIDETDTGYRLTGELHAHPIPPDQPVLDIKAPTYSQMRIAHDGEWTVEAVLDV